jgi:peptidoglycan/xylan/chitin deacetylase (PgdA/CDA1 family)
MRNLIVLPILLLVVVVATAHADEAIISQGSRTAHQIALTFDACPTSHADEYDSNVIDVLLREQVPATLFLSGRWVERNREHAKFLAGQPLFELAAHSYSHAHLLNKDDKRVLRELTDTQRIIRNVTGKTPKYFRAPFGEVDERIANLALTAGLTTIQYDLESGDPDPSLSAKRITSVVVRDAKNGSIIVFHMNRNGIKTAEVLPGIIAGLRKRGFRLVTVGELLKQ